MCPNTGCSLQGVLAQAKNGDQVFWEEKFDATKGTSMRSRCLAFFFLLCLGGGGGNFFIFPFSQCFPIIFPSIF